MSTCPLCGSHAARNLYTSLVQCRDCGLVRTQHRVPSADPESLYEQAYFTERNAYLSNSAAFNAMFETLLDTVQQHKPSGRLLDVGCGPGLLLNAAKRRGYVVSGCDISVWATQYAREARLDVATGALESVRYAHAQFDVVIINHTLEHTPQPLEMLCEARRILADDGILVVGVPNFDSLMAHIMRTRWAGLLPDQHLWHFTPRTLRLILQRAGFVMRTLIVQPATHHHRNWMKRFVLRIITTVGNLAQRGESLLAVAAKPDHAT